MMSTFGPLLARASIYPSWRAPSPFPFSILQQPPADLVALGARQAVDEGDRTGRLVARHPLARPRQDIVRRDSRSGSLVHRHQRLHRFAAIAVGRRDHAALPDGGMLVHHRLHLGRPNLEAADVDHALQPVDREEITLSVAITEVAGAQK